MRGKLWSKLFRDRYSYLKVVMHQKGSFTCAVESLKVLRKASFALQARRAELGTLDPRDSLASSTMQMSGQFFNDSEVWMPLPSATGKSSLRRSS